MIIVTQHMPTWSLLFQPDSIMHAQWPEASTVDPLLLKESEYLTQVSHEFRVRIKKMVDLREKASARDVGPQCSVICIFTVNNHLYHVTILHVLCEIATTPTQTYLLSCTRECKSSCRDKNLFSSFRSVLLQRRP